MGRTDRTETDTGTGRCRVAWRARLPVPPTPIIGETPRASIVADDIRVSRRGSRAPYGFMTCRVRSLMHISLRCRPGHENTKTRNQSLDKNVSCSRDFVADQSRYLTVSTSGAREMRAWVAVAS